MKFNDDNDIEKVLAPVPSYNYVQSLEADRLAKNEGEEIVAKPKEENAKLKELLKECKDIIEWYKADCGYKDLPTENVLTKINKVIE